MSVGSGVNLMNQEISNKEKIISLYKFIIEFCKSKQKIICNDDDYLWKYQISNVPQDNENISVLYKDKVEVEDEVLDDNSVDYLLKVHKPEFEKCPKPDVSFEKWLVKGWDSYRNTVQVKEKIEYENNQNNSEKVVEMFTDDSERVKTYKVWLEKRKQWVERQLKIERTRNFFTTLYMKYVDLQRDFETTELILANGYITDKNNENICHPVLTKRLNMNFDANENTIYVMDTDARTELYSELFQVMDDIDLDSLTTLNSDLMVHDYHPMDRNDTSNFLKILVHNLSSDSKYIDGQDDISENRINMFYRPCLIMRKRMDGTIKATEQIIKNIEETGFIPSHLIDIISGGKLEKPEETEETIEESLAKVGGESVDILLSKEANREQLEIAKRIGKYNAVLVQGPPGTGKTHTIANLVGHFLAHGESVLVTSYTKKALNVLKDKLPKNIQSLCVSVLDDSNEDMEDSIDGITDYMSRTTSFELKHKMEELKENRLKVIKDLASVRRKIFNIINSEYKSIVLDGEEISPIDAACFVQQNKERLSYIDGRVKLYSPLPLTINEFNYLYGTNSKISYDEEKELNYKLPDPAKLIHPDKFEKLLAIIDNSKKEIEEIGSLKKWTIQINDDLFFETNFGNFYITNYKTNDITELRNYINIFSNFDNWVKAVCCDGKRGGAHKKRWLDLINEIKTTSKISENFIYNHFGKKVSTKNNSDVCDYKIGLQKLKKILDRKGKIGKIDLILNNEFNLLLSEIQVNGKQITTKEECDFVLDYIDLIEARNKLANLWDNLLSCYGVTKFYDLDNSEPERVAEKWIDIIVKYLNWYDKEYKNLTKYLEKTNFPYQIILQLNDLDKDIDHINKIFDSLQNVIPYLLDICETKIAIDNANQEIENSVTILDDNGLINSSVCINLKKSLKNYDNEKYLEFFKQLESLYQKYEILSKRNSLLEKLESVAPQWANDIRNRRGIHGLSETPANIQDAWKFKQYLSILYDMTKESLEDLQKTSQRLSSNYRKITENYAGVCAWYNLLARTECDIDMKQALKGWELTIKKIGKATGKNAPKYKAKARELMAKCQNAVPCWIMPMNKAIESLKPGENEFDVIIIDEASQSDISSLAISYFAKKMIVVGDDKQVSPMAVGVEIDKINALEKMFIKDKIPNSHLYSAKTSLYDIAATTFQPLMLKEHFRCVPEIIGFSNMLSYDFKIKPLRDSNDTDLLPSVINYRVQGKRIGKTNRVEAETIISFIKGCLNIKEYEGKTFGVISLLGDEQVRLIEQLLYQYIDIRDIEERKILVGNASNFQGDERDVIFLSMVDSGSDKGPLPLQGNGVEDSVKKRYNVAVSRARDQVWVVNSLDSANDLKSMDIRKKLLDYATNPKAFLLQSDEVKNKSDSVFEEQVAKKLLSQGYHIVQQYPVGAYRLDIVVICENRKIVIECDGERYHTGEEKIKEDMQRQAILERIGWRFIRIRGSQFFKNPEATMNQVFEELESYKIYPESININNEERTSELFEKVKNESSKFLSEIHQEDNDSNLDDILYALDNKSYKVSDSQKNNSTLLKNKIDSVSTSQNKQVNENIFVKNNDLLDLEFGESQFKYMVLFSEGVSRKDISLYYNVAYDTVKKSLQTVSEKYHQPYVEKCVSSFIEKYKGSTEYDEVINMYLKWNQNRKTERFNDNVFSINSNLESKHDNDDFITDLKKNNFQYIDNREKSGIVWIIHNDSTSELIKRVLSKYKYPYTFERRGSIVTENKPAWRVMFK